MGTSYNGKILRINLSTKQVSTEDLDLNLAKLYIGGRGLGTKILILEIDPATTNPLGEENKVIFITGPLTGTKVSTGTRYMVVTKSPLNNMIASSNSGGIWGSKLKYAGYDAVIVEGKAEKPVYINIKDEKVEILDASHLWGKETLEVEKQFKSNDSNASVLNIGPAGENLSLIAAVMNDGDRAAGRNGVGAVLGSKNLKAIVVSSTNKELPYFNAEEFKEVAIKSAKTLKDNPVSGQGLPTYGTAVLVNIINSIGSFPVNNWQHSQFDDAESVSGEELAEHHLVKNEYCHRCTIGCARVVKMGDKVVGGPEYETLWGFSGNCGISDMKSVIEANFWCNEFGLDTISTACTLSALMELNEKGFVPKEDFEGVEPQFGNAENMLYWLKKMGRSEGKLGTLLAKGSYALCEHYGHPELSMSVKKLEMPAYDARGIQGIGLNYATSNRGACHVRGYIISPEVLGLPTQLDRTTTEGKGTWVKIIQDLTAVIDSLGLCLFTSFALGADEYTNIFNAATGFNLTPEELMLAGERIYNLERQFNKLAGMKPEDDTLPKRLLTEAVQNQASEGMVNQLDVMLKDYYTVRGWVNGFPTQETLTRLGV